MHVEFTSQLEEQVCLIKEQSDQVIELRTNEVQLQYELKYNEMRDGLLEEMRSERELKMQQNLKIKLEKRLIEEISSSIREQQEAKIREEITAQVREELKRASDKEMKEMKRKLKISQQTKKDKLVSQHENEFTVRVNQQV